jgi:selenocysteine-specific elongation factor
MRRLILGTAGHIDHGKTALVHALTGVDTDRLPEEKRRGITIDLGFARLPLSSDVELSIVDVPGHEAFVRNMLAGATGIDLMLLVIAADEGVMPQTREHLAIIELLGIRRGVVALTKTDLVDDEWLDLVRDEVHDLLAPTPLADVELVAVSARTGAGLDTLRSALAAAADAAPDRSADDLFRMPIDRVFTVRGTGTVVTGTVWSGVLGRDANVHIEPAGLTTRVRALQQHGQDTDDIRAGARAAVALTGIDRRAITRGDTLLAGAGWRAWHMMTVQLTTLRDADAPLRPRQRVRVHLGTGEVLGRLALYEGAVEPGATAIAQLRLEQPLVGRAGDRFVIRSYSPIHTIAGGVVLEPIAPKRKRLAERVTRALLDSRDPTAAVRAVLALADEEGVATAELAVRTGLQPARLEPLLTGDPAVVQVTDRVVASEHVDHVRNALLDCLHRFHEQHPLEEGMDRETLRRAVTDAAAGSALVDFVLQQLLAAGIVVGRGSDVAVAGFQPEPGPADRRCLDRLAATFADAGLEPPELAELPLELAGTAGLPALLRFLERDGVLVRLTPTRWADASAVSDCAMACHAQLSADTPLAVSDFKQVVNLTRKHLIPLLEYFDRAGFTLRSGETRRLNRSPARPDGRAAAGVAPGS